MGHFGNEVSTSFFAFGNQNFSSLGNSPVGATACGDYGGHRVRHCDSGLVVSNAEGHGGGFSPGTLPKESTL